MKVLIYGGGGWIGKQFIQILKNNNVEYAEGVSRVDSEKWLKEEINYIKPTHIISFIGRTHGVINDKVYSTIDYLEQPGKLTENIRDNLYSPLLLAIICKKQNIHLTYIGTGCIFKYDTNHLVNSKTGFTEESKPNFFGSSYSIVKGFTDRLMKEFQNEVLNLRIRMPITETQNPRNFITKITNYEKICSVKNSMTVLPELLPLVLDMMVNKTVGTINLTNPGHISHNEILELFKEIVDPSFNWLNMTEKEQNEILACERSNNFLETEKLEKLYPNIKNIKNAITYCLYEYKKTYKPSNVNEEKIDTLFVTGGCGFIGSNFINHYFYKNKNVTIINYDCLYYCGKKENIKEEIRNSERYVFIEGNLQSFDLLKHILQTNKITHIIHFAAQSHVQTSFDDSLKYTDDNIVGTHTLLETNRLYNNNLEKFIHVSTDEVYGESLLETDEKKTEQSILCPTNPYAATKAGAEMLVISYKNSFNIPIIITRGNNVYGPNQYPEKLIPKFISLLKENKKLTIHGDGSCVRGFLYSSDTDKAFETILKKGKIGEIYNIGCDESMEYSVLDVAKIIIRKMKGKHEDVNKWITYTEDRPFNDKRYYINSNKLKELGWNQTVDFESGIEFLLN